MQLGLGHKFSYVQHQEIPCEMAGGITPCKNVLAEKRVIPPYSEVVMKGKIHRDDAPEYGVLVGQKQFMEKKVLGVARTLVRRQGRVVPVG